MLGAESAAPAEMPDVSDLPTTFVGIATGDPLVPAYDPPEQLAARNIPTNALDRTISWLNSRRERLISVDHLDAQVGARERHGIRLIVLKTRPRGYKRACGAERVKRGA